MHINMNKHDKYIAKSRKNNQPMVFKELVFLGTTSGIPTLYRNVSSMCLIFMNGDIWMFDCGEATQHQILKNKNISISKITKIFITHLHGDHLYGLPGLISTISSLSVNSEEKKEIEIYGPLNLGLYLRNTFAVNNTHLNIEYRVNEFIPCGWDNTNMYNVVYYQNEKNTVYIECDKTKMIYNVNLQSDIVMNVAVLTHTIFSVGYCITEPTSVGALNMDKVNNLQIPVGNALKQLKNGETITFKDIHQNIVTVTPDQVLEPPLIGRTLVILGDTSNSKNIINITNNQNVDWLVHEATIFDEDENIANSKKKAISRGHSTPYMAGEFAGMLNAKYLLLTHFGSQFSPESEWMEKITISAQNGYNSVNNTNSVNIMAVEDFTVINLMRK